MDFSLQTVNLKDNSLASSQSTFLVRKDKVLNTFLYYFSPKQLSRPDSFFDCCQQVFPYAKQIFAEQIWKAFYVVKPYILSEEDFFLNNGLVALKAISEIEDSIFKGNTDDLNITVEQAKCIESFLTHAITEEEFTRLNAYLSFTGNGKLWSVLKACKELFLPLNENCVEILQRKMEAITQILQQPLDSPFNVENKLTPKDFRLLIVSKERKKMLEIFDLIKVNCFSKEELHTAWSKIETLQNSEAMQDLRQRCKQGYRAGRIFFYDWNFVKIRDFYPLDLMWAAKHILYSRIPHLGIIIQDIQGEPKLSHVNGGMGTHGIHPIRLPTLGALGNFAELDISPLIPQAVSQEDAEQLKKCFSEAFIKFASESHPEVKLEEKPYCLLSHKQLKPQDLSEIDFNSKESQYCSSYVGMIFLKAINEVNKQLGLLQYQEKISHPFGEHEIINRMDTLRLLYHWKELKIFKVVPLDFFVEKVFLTPTL